MDQQESKTSNLSPIGTLFSDSWKIFSKSVLALILLYISTLAVVAFFAIAGLALIIFTGVGSAFLKNGYSALTSLSIQTITTLCIAGIIFLIIGAIIAAALQITQTLVVDEGGQGSLLAKFKKSFGFILPLFFINLVTGFLVLGGFFLFLIPGIIIAILFSFVQFEVVLSNHKNLNSLKRSVAIISKNFGGIFVRFLLIFLIYIGIVFFFSLLENIAGEAKPIITVISWIFDMVLSWYMLVFSITLYKQARSATSEGDKANIVWVFIIAILGWLIALTVGYLGFKTATSDLFKAKPSISMEKSIEAMNPQAKVHFDKSTELFKQIKENENDPVKVKKLNDENIAELKKAAELDPENAKIWNELGNAYTWLSTKGSWDDVLASYQKAALLEPQNTIYIDNVGVALTSLTRYDEAILQLQNSLRINASKGLAESGLTNYRLGQAYLGLKIYDSARENFKKAIEIFEGENSDGYFDSYILQAKKELSSMPK